MEHFTLEKFIFYVKDVNTRLCQTSIFSNEVRELSAGEPKYQFMVHGITKLNGQGPSWLPEATHKVTAIRVTQPEHSNTVKFEPGTDFFILSGAAPECDGEPEVHIEMIKSEDISRFILNMINQRYVLYDTFGFIAGLDFPYDVVKTDTLTKFWYKVTAPNGEVQTMTPWLASYLKDPVKLVVDIEFEGKEVKIVRS